MIVVIHDANVLIDLHVGGLLDAFFRLGWENHTTEAVLDEVEQPMETFVKRGLLKVETLHGEDLVAIAVLRARQPRRVSIEDCSLLWLAERMRAALLTGDANLARCARDAKLTVHGTLWILDELVKAAILSSSEAQRAMERMREVGRRLPEAPSRERIARWSKKANPRQ